MPFAALRINVGDRFTRLTVLEVRRGARHTECLCRCDCGHDYTARASNLTRRTVKSCGCYAPDFNSVHKRTHGQTTSSDTFGKTVEYRCWRHIKSRCYNSNVKDFENYGGRGITVCDRWRESFESFYADMGARPATANSIERIDNDGPYSPQNCRWATRSEQARNRRNVERISHGGDTLTVPEWATRLGIDAKTLRARLASGWSHERTITQHLRPHRSSSHR